MGSFVTSDPALDDEARRRAKFDQPEAVKPEAVKPEGDDQPERKPRRNSK